MTIFSWQFQYSETAFFSFFSRSTCSLRCHYSCEQKAQTTFASSSCLSTSTLPSSNPNMCHCWKKEVSPSPFYDQLLVSTSKKPCRRQSWSPNSNRTLTLLLSCHWNHCSSGRNDRWLLLPCQDPRKLEKWRELWLYIIGDMLFKGCKQI